MAEIPVLEAAPADAPAPAGKRKKLIIIAAAALVVLGGGGAGAWVFLKGGDDVAREGEPQKEEDAEPKAPPQYVALEPPFVVNFESESNVRFLQVSVQAMTRDLPTVEQLKSNDPAIRNDLLLLLGNQKYEAIASREGKEALRGQALETVRRIVKDNGGKPELVEQVYFTSFVMQ
jgi:flagellar protein FliL